MNDMQNEIKALRAEIQELRNDVQQLTGLVRFLFDSQIAKVDIQNETKNAQTTLIEEDKNCMLSTRARNVLYRANVFTLRDLSYINNKSLAKMRCCGQSTQQEILDYMQMHEIIPAPTATGNLPEYHIGEPVLMVTKDRCYKYCEAGAIVTIRGLLDKNYPHRFELPLYKVSDTAGHTFYVSPGQIKKISN